MMDRRLFLRRAALSAAGAIAADQLELLERLAPRRRFFTGMDFGAGPPSVVVTFAFDQANRCWQVDYLRDDFEIVNGAIRHVRPLLVTG
jgi:hypothetical protein